MLQHIAIAVGQWRRTLAGSVLQRPPTDPVTGLPCGASLRATADSELARSARFQRPLTVLAVVLDPAAEPSPATLRRFAGALRHQTRGFDLVGRTDDGGFLVLLPEATEPEAISVADRVQRQALACFGTTVRVGMAAFPRQGLLLDELLVAARANWSKQLAEWPLASGSEDERSTRRLNRFVAAVVLAGLCVLIASPAFLSAALLLQLLPFLVLAVLAERFTSLKYQDSTMTLSSMGAMAAAVLGGPAAGAIGGCVEGLAGWAIHRRPLKKGIFNIGMLVLSGASAGLPYWWLGSTPSLSAGPLMLLPGLVAGSIFFITNFVLLAQILALAARSTFRTEWRLRCNWLAVHYAVMGLVSLGLALLYQSYGLTGLVLLLAPIGVLQYAQRQYFTNTAAHVSELSSLNQELTAGNQRLTEMNTRLERTLGDLQLANESMLTALCEALELRDRETEGHSQRVVRYARATAVALGLAPDDVNAVVHGAHLHDLGKIGIADAILRKPGPLTPEEWAEMKQHPEIGYRMIEHIPFLARAAVLVRHHHERWDGRGYPAGLGKTTIPIGARIFAVVDSFDAMTSDRPYRAAMTREAAIAELERGSGNQYDPTVVEVFIRLLRTGAPEVQPDGQPAPLLIVRPDSQLHQAASLTTVASAS